MARPLSRGRRTTRDEEDDDRRRGRGAAPRRPSGPPAGLIVGGLAAVTVAAIVGIAVATSGRKAPPPATAPALVPAPKPAEPPPPPPPKKAPPRPLTEEEKAYIEGLFREAQPHIDAFRRLSKEGWDRKGHEDNDGANEAWVKAKHEVQAAVQIVSEALEDEERFPLERPGMPAFNARLVGWQKELAQLPKVNVVR